MKKEKIKVGFTVGCFDMLHQGHIDLFKQMKKEGATSIFVLLHDDKSIFKNKSKFPVQPFNLRRENLAKCGYVDATFMVATANPSAQILSVISVWSQFPFNKELFYMRGDDWVDFPGKCVLDEYKIPIKIKKYFKGVSSSKIRASINN